MVQDGSTSTRRLQNDLSNSLGIVLCLFKLAVSYNAFVHRHKILSFLCSGSLRNHEGVYQCSLFSIFHCILCD